MTDLETTEKLNVVRLFMAVATENTGMVDDLLRLGLHIDERDENGQTALIFAARHGRADMVRFLLSRGAEIDAQTIFSKEDVDGFSALAHAADQGNEEIATILLDAGASLDLPCREVPSIPPWTPLMIAIANSRTPVAQALIDRGADTEARDGYGQTAVFYAAHYAAVRDPRGGVTYGGNEEIIAALANKGAAFGVLNDRGESPLHFAILGRCECAVAAALIERGAQINAPDEDGNAPLIYAAREQDSPMIRLLIDSGADVTMRNNLGETVLDILENDSRNPRPLAAYHEALEKREQRASEQAAALERARLDTLHVRAAERQAKLRRIQRPKLAP